MTVAFALQLALAGTLLAAIGLAAADAIRYDGLIDQAARATGASRAEVDEERSAHLFGTLIVAMPALLLAGWFGATAWWLRRGSNVARIMALVGLAAPMVLGLLFCLVGGLGGLLLTGLLVASPDGGFPEEEGDFPEDLDGDGGAFADGGFYDELWRLDSGPWSAVSGALGLTATAAALILAATTAVLLLTGPSNRYFRPQRPVPALPYPMQPFAMQPPYPTQPPYPMPAPYPMQPPDWRTPAGQYPAPLPYPQHPAYGHPPQAPDPTAPPAPSPPPNPEP